MSQKKASPVQNKPSPASEEKVAAAEAPSHKREASVEVKSSTPTKRAHQPLEAKIAISTLGTMGVVTVTHNSPEESALVELSVEGVLSGAKFCAYNCTHKNGTASLGLIAGKRYELQILGHRNGAPLVLGSVLGTSGRVELAVQSREVSLYNKLSLGRELALVAVGEHNPICHGALIEDSPLLK